MTPTRQLVYASDVVPGQGHGGRIIIDRHLRRLAREGWSITVVTPFGQTAATGPWREIKLPGRRWWWPPFRPSQPWLASLRALAWRRELVRAGLRDADAILTICWGSTTWFAVALARAWRRPLTVIVHDWWQETGLPANTHIGRYACRHARTVFAVSVEMQTALARECGRDIVQLYPLPAARTLPFARWRESHSAPAVAHAGTLHAHHEEFLLSLAQRLATVGGRLLLLCPRDNAVALSLGRRCPNLVQQDFFPTNEAALQWLATHASALAVMYPQGRTIIGQPPTGFPSRFVEFTQLGLPILLAAPAGNPIRTWATSRAWPGHCDPADGSAVNHWLQLLTQAAGWSSLAAATRTAAVNDFDPDALQARFAAALIA